jgi:hypothetical protein
MKFSTDPQTRIVNIIAAMQNNHGDNFVQQMGCSSLSQLCLDEETAEIVVEKKGLQIVSKAMAKYRLDRFIAQSGSYVFGRIALYPHLHSFVVELTDEHKEPCADALLTAVMKQFPVHQWQAVHFSAQWAQLRLRTIPKTRPKPVQKIGPAAGEEKPGLLRQREPMGMNAAASYIQGLYRAKKAYRSMQTVLLGLTEKLWNPDEKKFFYYNSKTGESTYEKPRHLDAVMMTQKYELARQEIEMRVMTQEDKNVLKMIKKVPKKKRGYGGF